MNCSFNIRYKPRTTRAFTKSDLTVYDSADNTALNALTVYGKSEVVDGAIKSAGEGYAVVRLADLTWLSGYGGYYTNNTIGAQLAPSTADIVNAICNKYTTTSYSQSTNKTICGWAGGNCFLIKDSDYTTVSDFVASLGEATLCYELADPTQGNCIAVKTDNDSGINGTMATFTTGTPLRGITGGARDVMTWDGSAGTVTKNCGEVDLGTLNWAYNNNLHCFQSGANFNFPINALGLLPLYTLRVGIDAGLLNDKEYTLSSNGRVYIKDTDYNDATAFKTAMSGVMLVYELATPTTQTLTQAENDSIAALRAFTPQTHAQNNAGTEMTVNYTIRVPTI